MKRKALTIAVGLALAACAGGSEPVSGTIEVTGQDYSYNGVPELVATGAELTFTNGSEAEFHEMVLMKIADGETRTVEEILELPEEESSALVEFQGVMVAMPNEVGFNAETQGESLMVGAPGRYVVICFIPQGADPAVVAESMQSEVEGPPDLGDGTPHAFLGMVQDFQVEEA